MRGLLIAAAAAVLVGVAACGTGSADPGDDGSVQVVAAFYPLQFIAERVGGAHVSVTNLAAPGVEPHDLELSPSQVADIARADLVVYLRGFQPAVDEAVAQNAAGSGFDVLEVVPVLEATAPDEHGHEGEAEEHEEEAGSDPHVWLDPRRVATIAEQLAGRLGELDPDHAGEYTAGAGSLGDDLAALDTGYTDGLANCERREIVVSHAAFGYLADRYDLEQIGISGLSPEAEPTPEQLAAVAEEAEHHGATTIFFEVLVSPEVAQVIADQVGAETAVLDPIEGLAPDSDGDYLSLMRTNLETLRVALGCT